MKFNDRSTWLYVASGLSSFAVFTWLMAIPEMNRFFSLAQFLNSNFKQEELIAFVGNVASPLKGAIATNLCSPDLDVTSQILRARNPDSGELEQASFSQLVRKAGIETITYANAKPFPQIHDRARLARVPVMMYHDVIADRQVFFDITPERLRQDFETIREKGLTPIALEQLVLHLQTGLPLPEKPILLTFDDGYESIYTEVYPLLKEFNYPATFAIYTAKPDGLIIGRSTVTWQQLKEMSASSLVTIAAHSVTHPSDLTKLTDDQIQQEIIDSKRILEEKLGIPIRYFSYPEGHYNDRVVAVVQAAGFEAALTMDKDSGGRYAGESESVLAIARFGESSFEEAIEQAWGGAAVPWFGTAFDFTAPVEHTPLAIEGLRLDLVSGGRPATIHADSRYQVSEILQGTEAIAGVDGAFFSMEMLDSNEMIGPILSQSTGQFIPGARGVIPFLRGRPLVLLSPTAVKFVPFNPAQHNTLAGIQAELPNVTDAFVAAVRLVKEGQPQSEKTFGRVPNADIPRHRAFWGMGADGKPIIGISERVDAATLGKILAEAGFWDAVMLDSGASTSLVYRGDSLVGFMPRPVPHVVALMPPLANPCAFQAKASE